MTVSEFIKLWDSLNISTIPFVYYYTGTKILKHKLYNIDEIRLNLNVVKNLYKNMMYQFIINT